MNKEQIQEHIEFLYNKNDLPRDHVEYLNSIKHIEPRVIYDIGSCVLHWTKEAQKVWPNSKFYLFDAMEEVEFLYDRLGYEYNLGVLSDSEKDVTFYKSVISPGGNSYYKEDSWATEIYYGKDSEMNVRTQTLDDVIKKKKFMYPDLVKIDVQGCEIDILNGMKETLKHCNHIIVELQHHQYNIGAPMNSYSILFIESLGFELVRPLFCNNGVDGDYHFRKI